MTLSLEQEFEKRKQEVMKRIVGMVTTKIYVDKQMKGIQIPTFLVDKEELIYRGCVVAEKVVNHLEETGELQDAFEESWKEIAESLP